MNTVRAGILGQNSTLVLLALLVHILTVHSFFIQKNIKNAVSQNTRKILLFQKKSDFSEVRRAVKFLMSHKIRLIICLSSHKKFMLKAIYFVWEKIEVFRRIFFLDFCGRIEIDLCLQWLTIYYGLEWNNLPTS
jgi:hypothetical protein